MNCESITKLDGFTHLPGNHCGSTALRNLLGFHGVEISEEMAFGLGAGPCFYYLDLPGTSPSRFLNGRTGRLEEEFLRLTGVPLRLRTEADPESSWRLAAEVVDSGRPALLITDLYYLDHYGSSAHFPGHAVVLVGYDEESAYVADTGFEQIQQTSRAGLAKARHEQHPFYPLAGHMLDLPEGERIDREAMIAAAPAAIARAAGLMLEPALGRFEGVAALDRLAAEIGSWPDLLEDWQWCARFGYQAIERRGTGGGSFRLMYGRFLAQLGYPEASLATRCGERWSELAAALFAASEQALPQASTWNELAVAAASIRDAEVELWESLAARSR